MSRKKTKIGKVPSPILQKQTHKQLDFKVYIDTVKI